MPKLNQMKFTITFTGILTLIAAVSCDGPLPGEQVDFEDQAATKSTTIPPSSIEIIIFDECEYIMYKEKEGTNLAYGYMAHKGNCQNPEHRSSIVVEQLDSLDTTGNELTTTTKTPVP